jgi:hypothetical protein
MNNPFEHIDNKINELLKRLDVLEQKIFGEKRWLSTSELAQYIPYSKESINKKVQNGEFIYGVHFHQHSKIRMFDKIKIDEWITNNKLSKEQEQLKENLLQKIQNDL